MFSIKNEFVIFTLIVIIGVTLGLTGWFWYSHKTKKIPESATRVMHNKIQFGEFF